MFVGLAAGAGYCLILISGTNLSGRESALLGMLLAGLSVLASWIMTHLYSESQYKRTLEEVQEQHRTNLRMYALKAAEKVNNLSNELNRLSIYLEQELNYQEYPTSEEALQAKEGRIESSIHIIRTLKSVNDTSLSDWEGVIGDELDQQREERAEKEEELRSVIERVESVIEDQHKDVLGTRKDTEALWAELSVLKRELRSAVFNLGGPTLPRKSAAGQQKTWWKHAARVAALHCITVRNPSCAVQRQSSAENVGKNSFPDTVTKTAFCSKYAQLTL